MMMFHFGCVSVTHIQKLDHENIKSINSQKPTDRDLCHDLKYIYSGGLISGHGILIPLSQLPRLSYVHKLDHKYIKYINSINSWNPNDRICTAAQIIRVHEQPEFCPGKCHFYITYTMQKILPIRLLCKRLQYFTFSDIFLSGIRIPRD